MIRDGISRELTMARHYGLYSAFSSGRVSTWTHNDTQHFMVKNRLLHHYVDGSKPMAMGTAFILDYSNATIRNRVVPIFQKCAYTQKCIVPRNSSGENHRHDQSILTLLINNFNIPYCASLKYHYTPATHTDGLRREGTERALKNILIKIKNTYSIVFTNAIYNTTDWRQTREEFIGVSRPVDQEWQ